MPLRALDERTALIIVDPQNGVRARPVAPEPVAAVVARGTRAEVLELLRVSRSGAR
ncbi:hypothetical protein [Nocardia sp. NBC_01329]|uniref:hypothetical protein n=1 Tax=Nocardia sp. NBC_01329 TaxID=2903594 RepID=UPI002E1423EB|nr:hypothetical protein OG405_19875 [Nocardia sp. NBC_01329]